MASLDPSLSNVDPSANRQPEILRVTLPCFVIAVLAVICRFWSRRLKKAAVAADDYPIGWQGPKFRGFDRTSKSLFLQTTETQQ